MKRLLSLLGTIGLLVVVGSTTISCKSNKKKKIHLSTLVNGDKYLGIVECWGEESLKDAIIRKFLYKYKQNTCLQAKDLRLFVFNSNVVVIEASEFNNNFVGQVEMIYWEKHISPPWNF